MAIIDDMRDKIARGQFECSQHAVDQSIVRHISVQALREAMTVGAIIEDDPDDTYGPSCVVYGLTLARRPVPMQCSDPSRPLVKIITLYEPDPRRWGACKVRRPSDEPCDVARNVCRPKSHLST